MEKKKENKSESEFLKLLLEKQNNTFSFNRTEPLSLVSYKNMTLSKVSNAG